MANIFDYLIWRGDLPLSVSPFNEVDGAVFARLSYLPFELIMPCDSPVSVTIADAAAALISLNIKKPGSLRKENDAKLLEMLLNSRRFRDIELFGYSHLFDAATQTQFSAVTFRPSKNKLYVFFRGTDSTLVGWKEDFNMCFVCPVPAQSNAVDYLNRIAASNGGDITVGGHSKGGNLAVYASAFCEQAARRRITHIYNYDGPGFTEDVLNSDSYKSICVLVNTFVPQSSVVGMLLGHEEKYTIIHSTESGILKRSTTAACLSTSRSSIGSQEWITGSVSNLSIPFTPLCRIQMQRRSEIFQTIGSYASKQCSARLKIWMRIPANPFRMHFVCFCAVQRSDLHR